MTRVETHGHGLVSHADLGLGMALAAPVSLVAALDAAFQVTRMVPLLDG